MLVRMLALVIASVTGVARYLIAIGIHRTATDAPVEFDAGVAGSASRRRAAAVIAVARPRVRVCTVGTTGPPTRR